MSEIYVKENESLDNALKRFKRSCAKAGVLADLRKKEYYQAPASSAARSPKPPARTRTSATIDEKAPSEKTELFCGTFVDKCKLTCYPEFTNVNHREEGIWLLQN